MDCLLVTDRLASGPNALFEALASGVPVVSTRVGWSPQLIADGENGFLADTPGQLAAAVERIAVDRPAWFDRREQIRRSLGGWSVESWIRENLELAYALAPAPGGVVAAPNEPAVIPALG
jgi:glycosyltransferase involved in cell wall biosynthesis